MGIISSITPITSAPATSNQTQPQATVQSSQETYAQDESLVINEVNNVSLLSGSSIEILNQIEPTAGENVTVNVTNNVTDVSSGSGNASLQQIEQQIGAVILKDMEQLLNSSQDSATAAQYGAYSSSSSGTATPGQMLNTLV